MRVLKLILLSLFFLTYTQNAEAQFLKKLVKHAKEKAQREAEDRTEQRVDKGIDKVYDEAEDEIDGKNTKSKKKHAEKTNTKKSSVEENEEADEVREYKKTNSHQPKVVWSRYDFVPGDTVIFEDAPSPDEENGEFPSRWDLFEGGAEIAEVDGKPVITIITDMGNMHSKGIIPYLKNPEKDYLPDVFTVEFDAWYPPKHHNDRYYITFFDRKNQQYFNDSRVSFFVNNIEFANAQGALSNKERPNWDAEGGWRHIAIAFTRGKMKIYMDDQRLINIPHYEHNPTGITLSATGKNYIKNFRIAKGGVKYYKRVMTDGKIIVNGIKFDVNKATLKPESMGPINRIYKLMKKQPDLRFSVEGHTDSDGDDDFNMELSKKRAKTVMDKLIAMGIDASRLKYTGWGESKPIDNNNTPEGKANNRRVEFVKF